MGTATLPPAEPARYTVWRYSLDPRLVCSSHRDFNQRRQDGSRLPACRGRWVGGWYGPLSHGLELFSLGLSNGFQSSPQRSPSFWHSSPRSSSCSECDADLVRPGAIHHRGNRFHRRSQVRSISSARANLPGKIDRTHRHAEKERLAPERPPRPRCS